MVNSFSKALHGQRQIAFDEDGTTVKNRCLDFVAGVSLWVQRKNHQCRNCCKKRPNEQPRQSVYSVSEADAPEADWWSSGVPAPPPEKYASSSSYYTSEEESGEEDLDQDLNNASNLTDMTSPEPEPPTRGVRRSSVSDRGSIVVAEDDDDFAQPPTIVAAAPIRASMQRASPDASRAQAQALGRASQPSATQSDSQPFVHKKGEGSMHDEDETKSRGRPEKERSKKKRGSSSKKHKEDHDPWADDPRDAAPAPPKVEDPWAISDEQTSLRGNLGVDAAGPRASGVRHKRSKKNRKERPDADTTGSSKEERKGKKKLSKGSTPNGPKQVAHNFTDQEEVMMF